MSMPATPSGYFPWEISALINESVVRQHAEEAAFLWSARHRAAKNIAYDLPSLSALDRRVQAHLAGLLEAGDAGWSACHEALERANAGTIFALSWLAFATSAKGRMRDALIAATADEQLLPGLVSALAWLEPTQVELPLRLLATSAHAQHRAIALRVAALQRHSAEAALTRALLDTEAHVRAHALRTACTCMRRELVPTIRDHLGESDGPCRFWAAYALALLAPSDDPRELLTFADDEDPALAYRAADLAVRVLPLAQARDLIRHLVKHARWSGLGVAVVGTLGETSAIPWLIEHMQDKSVARVAAAAFTAITGVHLAKADLTQVGSADLDDEEPAETGCPWFEEAQGMPLPSAPAVAAWWSANKGRFPAGVRFLAGRPIDLPTAMETLRSGNQIQRRSAAMEVALHSDRLPLFNVHARGRRQEAELQAWTS